MRSLMVLLCAVMLLNGVGCAAGFQGQWLEDGIAEADGTVTPVKPGQARLAIEFAMPWVVRYGKYVDDMNVVDHSSVQSSNYFTFDGDQTAQFGTMIARCEGNRLVLKVSDSGKQRHFVRVQGRQIFPPVLQWPDALSSIEQPRNSAEYAALLERLDQATAAQVRAS